MSISELKTAIRRRFTHHGQSHVPERAAVDSLVKNLSEVVAAEPGTWAAFKPAHHEPPIDALFTTAKNVEWAFPKVSGEHLEFFVPESEDAFTMSRWKIREPDTARSRKVSMNEIRGLLIPGLVFGKRGERLGRGRGFYDQLLGSLKRQHLNPLKVGVAFEWQISPEEIPCDSHDVSMDIVVTEKSVHRCPSLERTI